MDDVHMVACVNALSDLRISRSGVESRVRQAVVKDASVGLVASAV